MASLYYALPAASLAQNTPSYLATLSGEQVVRVVP